MSDSGADNNGLIHYRLDLLEKAVTRVASALEKLASIELLHTETRALADATKITADDHETRIRDMEGEMPTLKLTRQWIISGVIGIWGVLIAVCVAAVKVVVSWPS